MNTDPQPSGPSLSHDLAPQLEPALAEVCGGRLRDIHWFKADWQRSGAATAYGTYTRPDGTEANVVAKLPIGYTEYRFTTGLNGRDRHFPVVVEHGTELGGYDFAWIVLERLPGDPLTAHLHKDVFRQLADAAAAFHFHAAQLDPNIKKPTRAPWEDLLAHAREAIHTSHIPNEQNWSNAVKHVQRALPKLLGTWRARALNTWCHGDLHPGNLMSRAEGSVWGEPSCVLLDMAEVHAGHWVEDAVYLERLFWGRSDALDGVKPVSLIARARKQLGLDASDDYAGLANIRRVLIAACVPAFLHREGHPAYLQGALEVLERLLPVVTK